MKTTKIEIEKERKNRYNEIAKAITEYNADGSIKIGYLYKGNKGDDKGCEIMSTYKWLTKKEITYDMEGVVYEAPAENEKEIEKEIEKERKERKEMIANGYCPKCDSYCYGDCEAG